MAGREFRQKGEKVNGQGNYDEWMLNGGNVLVNKCKVTIGVDSPPEAKPAPPHLLNILFKCIYTLLIGVKNY
ncbi:MAG: hypothetical protein R2941_21240 [Desulfobacterales bacterium]